MNDGQRPTARSTARLVVGRDYRLDARGCMVFTAAYLRARGVCCGSKCRNCPFGWENVLPADRVKGEPQPPLDKPDSDAKHKRSS